MAPRTPTVHAASWGDLAAAAVFVVAALFARLHYDDVDAAVPLQFVLWSFAVAAAVRGAVRWMAIELTGSGSA
jgi:hypothetical protein